MFYISFSPSISASPSSLSLPLSLLRLFLCFFSLVHFLSSFLALDFVLSSRIHCLLSLCRDLLGLSFLRPYFSCYHFTPLLLFSKVFSLLRGLRLSLALIYLVCALDPDYADFCLFRASHANYTISAMV